MRFYVVGSALRRKRPRDTDLIAVMEDLHFRAAYGLEPDELALLYEMGGDTVDGDLVRWRAECLGATRVLQYVFPELVPIDFKILPRSLLHEPNVEVDVTAATSTWGVGRPDLCGQAEQLGRGGLLSRPRQGF